MSRSLRAVLWALRGTGVAALLLLLVNPPWLRVVPAAQPPLVLLDASLSLGGTGGRWAEALDSARAAAGGGVVWRFGDRIAAFDTFPPDAGASRLAPALAAAAARRGRVTVVTDGEVATDGIATDLRARPRIVVLPRPPFHDAFVAQVTGARRVARDDTLRLMVTVGAAGRRRPDTANGPPVRLTARLDGRRLADVPVTVPDSGTVAVVLALPASRLPAGSVALTIGLEGAGDAEPRDDARRYVVETTTRPGVVVLADPPDWELRFLARVLGDVVRAPVRTFVRTAPGTPWRDGATLAPLSDAQVVTAVGGARLIVHRAGAGAPGVPPEAARWVVDETGQEGDWYVTRPPASRLAAALAGVAWDSLPPLTAASEAASDSAATTVLAAALLRRGRPVPVVLLEERGAARRVTLRAAGFWRWAFRGGSSEVAYRALVAGLADWLLGAPGERRDRTAPVEPEVPNGLPLVWRRAGADSARDLVIRLEAESGRVRTDTLRFDVAGRAEVRLPPGVWRYTLADGPERGLVVVDTWSAEWRPAAPTVASQPGIDATGTEPAGVRERWWLFALALGAFAAEWVVRRRQGLP